jgi:hypothetical protein
LFPGPAASIRSYRSASPLERIEMEGQIFGSVLSMAATGAALNATIGTARTPYMPPRTSALAYTEAPRTAYPDLNRFHTAARGLSETGQNNIRVLRGWAKSKGWHRQPNPLGQPETWGLMRNGQLDIHLRIKPEPSLRHGLGIGSQSPRFDARLTTGPSSVWSNPFTGETGSRAMGTHIPLENKYWTQ